METRDPVALVKSLWQRYGDGGLPAVMPYVHDDVTWTPHDRGGRPLHGREEILEHGRRLAARGVRMETVAHRFEDHDDGCVVVVGRVRVLGPAGHYDVPMSWQVEVADGRVSAVRAERRVEDARADCAA